MASSTRKSPVVQPRSEFFRDHCRCRDIDLDKFRMGDSVGPQVLIRSMNAEGTRGGLRVSLTLWTRILATWSRKLDPQTGEIGVAPCWEFAKNLRNSFEPLKPQEMEVVRFISRCSGIRWEAVS
jgi:hypothetical protein